LISEELWAYAGVLVGLGVLVGVGVLVNVAVGRAGWKGVGVVVAFGSSVTITNCATATGLEVGLGLSLTKGWNSTDAGVGISPPAAHPHNKLRIKRGRKNLLSIFVHYINSFEVNVKNGGVKTDKSNRTYKTCLLRDQGVGWSVGWSGSWRGGRSERKRADRDEGLRAGGDRKSVV
jgi:hypothetical protein